MIYCIILAIILGLILLGILQNPEYIMWLLLALLLVNRILALMVISLLHILMAMLLQFVLVMVELHNFIFLTMLALVRHHLMEFVIDLAGMLIILVKLQQKGGKNGPQY